MLESKGKNANSSIISPNILNVFKDFRFSDLWSAHCHLFYQLTLVMVFLPSLCFPIGDRSAGELFSLGVPVGGFAFVSAEELMIPWVQTSLWVSFLTGAPTVG